MVPFELRTLAVAQLLPAPYNPRRIPSQKSPAYRKLKGSLKEFGLVEPLVWNADTGHVVGGHLRLRIVQELGITEVPVSVVHLAPAREKALNIVLNNQEAQGRYDPGKLADLLEELADLPELDATGFDHTTLRNLRMEPQEDEPDDGGDPDRVEVTVVTDAGTFSAISPRLDALIREFDLESHVKRG